MAERKIIIGILGGVYSGKTLVAGRFARLGCAVIDADKIAHGLLEDYKQQITAVFGSGICRRNGQIDRDRLGERVFQSRENLTKINNILHPPVLARTEELIAEYDSSADIKAIILDMPLLMEVGWAKRCDKLVFVSCSDERRAERAQKNGHSQKNYLKKRDFFQISLDKKADIAHYAVSNNSDLSALAEQVERIFSIIISDR